MTRAQLEHVIRASGAIAEVDRLVILGSQAILGAFPDAPSELLTSMEVDLYPPDRVERADLIDGSIGEDSLFHETFGYYAHGVGPETALLPQGWQSRLVRIRNENTNQVEGLCISPVDLAVSKLLAGREKDVAFVRNMFRFGLLCADAVAAVAPELPDPLRRRLLDRLRMF